MRRVDLQDSQALEGRRILKASEFRDIAEAADILSQARSWSEAYRAEIEADLEERRREALAEGYAEGLSQFADAVARYDRAAEAVGERVLELLRDCLGRVMDAVPAETVLHDLIAPVLRDVRSEQEITVLVHPDALADLRRALERLAASTAGHLGLIARSDPGLGRQDCLIYTEDEVFNVSVPVTCDLLCRAVEAHLAAEADDAA